MAPEGVGGEISSYYSLIENKDVSKLTTENGGELEGKAMEVYWVSMITKTV